MKNWCKFFKEIEKDPAKIYSVLEVNVLVEACFHFSGCGTCYLRVKRVLAQAPKTDAWASKN